MRDTRDADFDVAALYEALDTERRSRGLSWRQATDEIRSLSAGFTDRLGTAAHPLSASTLAGMREKHSIGGNQVLQMLVWLERTPESFMPGNETDEREAALSQAGPDRRLRWDTAALHAALDTQRRERGMTWQQVAGEVGCSVSQLTGLTRLRYGPAFPQVMRMVRWLGRPAANFTFASEW